MDIPFKLKKVKWNNLSPGSIILSGVMLNDRPIPELTGFPIADAFMIEELSSKYKFLYNRELLVAIPHSGYSPRQFAKWLKQEDAYRNKLNKIRKQYSDQKQAVLKELGLDPSLHIPVIGSSYVEKEYLIKDTYNSFTFLYDEYPAPSYFSNPGLILSLSDVLSGQLRKKIDPPDDKEIMLHLAVDVSKSMDSMNKLQIVMSAVNNLCSLFSEVLSKTTIQLYQFSDECKPVNSPMEGVFLKRGETNFASFMKKVLHLRNREVYNKVIVFTDGLPGDMTEALRIAALLKKNKVDYTQIVFNIRDEQRYQVDFADGKVPSSVIDNVIDESENTGNSITLSDEELSNKMKSVYERFTQIAETAGGSQIILRINELLHIVSIECYDRYLGLLTATKREKKPNVPKPRPVMEKNIIIQGPKKRIIKPWTPKKL